MKTQVLPQVTATTSGPRRWKCICAYDGTAFAGWQSQAGGGALQDVIEARLRELFGQLVRVHGSGRTDAGVHALGQVFHFDAAWRHGPEKLRTALAAGLPRSIQVKSLQEAPRHFHARFSAVGKIYRYDIFCGDPNPFTRPWVWARPSALDLEAMTAAAAVLRGQHDFRAFAASRGTPVSDTVRHLRRLELKKRGRRLRIEAEADGFLYKMVRSLAGALVSVGEGRLAVARVRELLRGAVRTPEVPIAPAQGLFLVRVLYPENISGPTVATESKEPEEVE